MQLANDYKFGERVGILIVAGTPPNTDMHSSTIKIWKNHRT